MVPLSDKCRYQFFPFFPILTCVGGVFGQGSAPPLSLDTSHTNESLILGIREKQPSSCFCSHRIINGFDLLSEKCNLWITLVKIKSPLQFTSQKLLIVFSTNGCHGTSGIHHCFPFLSTAVFYPIYWRFLSLVCINYSCLILSQGSGITIGCKVKEGKRGGLKESICSPFHPLSLYTDSTGQYY